MAQYHIEEVADRPACWKDIKYFRRVETMEQIQAYIAKLSNCSYRRTFRIYWHHDAAKEAVMQITTEKGQILFVQDVGDQRKDYEKELDLAQWNRLHKNRRYGFDSSDVSAWLKKGAENEQNQCIFVKPDSYKPSSRILHRKLGFGKFKL